MEVDAHERLLVLMALGDLGDEETDPLPDNDELDATVAAVAATLASHSASCGRFAEAVVWQQVADSSPAGVEHATRLEPAADLWPSAGNDHAGRGQPESGPWSIDPGPAGRHRHG